MSGSLHRTLAFFPWLANLPALARFAFSFPLLFMNVLFSATNEDAPEGGDALIFENSPLAEYLRVAASRDAFVKVCAALRVIRKMVAYALV